MGQRWWVVGRTAVAIGIAALLAGCSSANSQGGQRPASATVSSTSSASSAAALPTNCDRIAVAADVDRVVGHQLPGAMSGIVGIPESSIGRVGRLDCYYGVPISQPASAAAVSIGIVSYDNQQDAAHRAALTVTSARDAGAVTNDVAVGTDHAVLLAGQQNQQLVLARGSQTVLVSVQNGVLPADKVGPDLIVLAQKALAAA